MGEFTPLRLLTRKNIQNKMRMKRTKVNDVFRYELTTCKNSKSSMLQENNPDATCMYKMNGRTERKNSVVSH